MIWLNRGLGELYVWIVFFNFEKFKLEVGFHPSLQYLSTVSGRDDHMVLAAVEHMSLSSDFHMFSMIRQEEDLGNTLCIHG